MRRIIVATSLGASLALGALALAPAVALASGGGGCGGPVTETAGTRVAIRDYCFSPTILRVAPGEEVVFDNRDSFTHNVLGANGIWGSYAALKGHRADTYRFTEPGVYPYVCLYHPGMVGAIVVGTGVGNGFEATTAAGPVAQVTSPELERAANVIPVDAPRERGPWTFVVIAGTAAACLAAGGAFALRRRRAAD
jgi:plastocyanin